MSIEGVLGVMSLPMIALGSLLFVMQQHQRPTGRRADLLVWFVVLLIGVPFFLVVFIYKNETELLSFDADAAYLLFGTAWLIGFRKLLDFKTTPGWDVLTVLIGFACIAIGGGYLAGDFLMPRQKIAGVVEGTFTTRGKAGMHYHVVLDAGRYYATGDVYATIHAGDRIEAEVGRASDTIFSFKPASAR
jgi:hypothetical protein